MSSLDPEALAARQVAVDRERTSRFPSLLAQKQRRMSASPFAFLRGAAPLFYEIIAQDPEFGGGPEGEGWLVGDLHLENFGAYAPARPASAGVDKRAAAFNLNDFDDAVRGPWRWDLLRLLTSLILAGRELGASGPVVLDLATRLLDSYVAAAFRGEPVPAQPAPVAALVERMRSRSRQALLDARTVLEGGQRRFVRGERYLELPAEIRPALPAAVEMYAKGLLPDERPRLEQLEIVDAAYRVAGTGSLGALRVALLVHGKGGTDGQWIFDMKEQSVPSAARLVASSALSQAERVVTAFRSCVDPPPRLLGTSRIGTSDVFVRRLTPLEDKLDLCHLKPESLGSLALYLGALVGAAHARAVEIVPPAWSERDRSELVRRAARMASLHEAIYLQWCFLIR